jgi:hypothetical protein
VNEFCFDLRICMHMCCASITTQLLQVVLVLLYTILSVKRSWTPYSCKGVYNSRYFTKTNYFSVGNIGDMCFSEKAYDARTWNRPRYFFTTIIWLWSSVNNDFNILVGLVHNHVLKLHSFRCSFRSFFSSPSLVTSSPKPWIIVLKFSANTQ